MQIHLHLVGILLITLALLHIVFPRYFNWSKELQSLQLVNRQMMVIHTFFIALTVLLMGLLCLTSANELMATVLGKRIAFCFGLFWGIRLLVQFFGYSTKLWKGKKFETVMHIFFAFLWTYFSAVFFLIFLNK